MGRLGTCVRGVSLWGRMHMQPRVAVTYSGDPASSKVPAAWWDQGNPECVCVVCLAQPVIATYSKKNSKSSTFMIMLIVSILTTVFKTF